MACPHELTPVQEIKWCKAVLYHAVIRSAGRYRRWEKEHVFLNSENAAGEEGMDLIPSVVAAQAFDTAELKLVVDTLTFHQRRLLSALYGMGLTQREVAQRWHVSQALVSKWHRDTLAVLKEVLEDGVY
jgi:RNA polymerase sigma factor (sigma-70 family)